MSCSVQILSFELFGGIFHSWYTQSLFVDIKACTELEVNCVFNVSRQTSLPFLPVKEAYVTGKWTAPLTLISPSQGWPGAVGADRGRLSLCPDAPLQPLLPYCHQPPAGHQRSSDHGGVQPDGRILRDSTRGEGRQRPARQVNTHSFHYLYILHVIWIYRTEAFSCICVSYQHLHSLFRGEERRPLFRICGYSKYSQNNRAGMAWYCT